MDAGRKLPVKIMKIASQLVFVHFRTLRLTLTAFDLSDSVLSFTYLCQRQGKLWTIDLLNQLLPGSIVCDSPTAVDRLAHACVSHNHKEDPPNLLQLLRSPTILFRQRAIDVQMYIVI